MSRFNPSGSGATSSGALWSAPISSQQQQQQAAEDEWRYAQQQNEQRYQQEQQQAQQAYYDDAGAQQQYPQQPDYDIYNKACAVSSPRLAGVSGDIDPRATITKTVMRRVEVPFTRSVQVPTQVVKLVPTTVEQKVPVRRLVETPGFQTVNESYIEYEDREAVREKEVWVKRIVPERYVERVPVQKVRQVQKPTTVIKEVDSWEVVSVPTTRRVVVDGYTVQEIPDSKLVEVEEEQTFRLRPEPAGPNEIKATRDLGRLPNPHSHLPDAPFGSTGSGAPLSQSGMLRSPTNGTQPRFGGSQGYNRPPTAAAANSSPFGAPQNPLEQLRAHGLSVDETHTRHTDGTGVVVTRIERGGAAARAGLQVSDVITAIQGRPTTCVAEFVALLQRAPGAVTLNVNRDGRRNLSLLFSK